MLAALLLMGIVPLAFMDLDSLFGEDDGPSAQGAGVQDDTQVDGPDLLDELADGQENVTSGAPQALAFGTADGMAVIEGFRPGSDRVEIDLSTAAETLEVVTGEAQGGPALALGDTAEDAPGTTLVFEGLDALPADDIFFLNAGGADGPIGLSELLHTAEPVDPEATGLATADPDLPFGAVSEGLDPVEPDQPDGPDKGQDRAGLEPNDPDAPGFPGGTSDDPGLDPTDPEEIEAPGGLSGDPGIDPEDPDAAGDPSPPGDTSRLAELLARDGAAPGGTAAALEAAARAGISVTTLTSGADVHSLTGDGAGGNVSLSDGTPVIASGSSQAVLDGGAGDDLLAAGNGPSWLFGGAGSDTVLAGGGMAGFGGAGDDALSASALSRVYLDGGAGNDTIVGGDGDDVLEGGEHSALQAAPDDDVIDGGAGNDVIRGGHGADTLSGGAGDDVIDHHGRQELREIGAGHRFDWRLDGAADSLSDGAGDDTLIFDLPDTASGGAGADTFWLHADAAGPGGVAEVSDFETGADFLRISLNPAAGHSAYPDVAVTPAGDDAEVRIDGDLVAILRGAADATLADVYVEVRADIFP